MFLKTMGSTINVFKDCKDFGKSVPGYGVITVAWQEGINIIQICVYVMVKRFFFLLSFRLTPVGVTSTV